MCTRYFSTAFMTARIRRMREGNISSLSTLAEGGVPHPADGGIPHPRSGWGYPIPRSGWGVPHSQIWMRGTLSQVWMRVPRVLWDTPIQVRSKVRMRGYSGYPHHWDWRGTPCPGLDGWGTPCLDWMGTPPSFELDGVPPCPHQKTEQHSTHLLHGGRYASCVQEGGLSCQQMLSKSCNTPNCRHEICILQAFT